MNDNFFEEFVMEIVIHKKYLSKKLLEMLKQDPITFPIDDPIKEKGEKNEKRTSNLNHR